jgi:hypothetical protein
LKKSSFDQMWTIATLKDGKPNSGNYGFAWFLNTIHGHHTIEHEGAWQGFNTSINRYVDDRLTVVVLANLAACDPGDIAHHVAGLYVPELTPDPEKKKKAGGE